MSDRSPASFDLADIVLADRDAREEKPARHRGDAWATQIRDRRSAVRSGYDATSVAIMALVVLAIAVILGFAVAAIRGTDEPLPAPTPAGERSAGGAEGANRDVSRDDAASVDAGAAKTAAAVGLVPGVQLAVGRVTAKPVRDGSGAVAINARINDIGTKLPSADRTVMVAVVLDGEIVGARPLQLTATPGKDSPTSGSAMVSFRTDSCASGTHSVSVIVDSTGVVEESNEADNARSTQLAWTC